eukprot:1621930-Amphidinium_carterae.1
METVAATEDFLSALLYAVYSAMLVQRRGALCFPGKWCFGVGFELEVVDGVSVHTAAFKLSVGKSRPGGLGSIIASPSKAWSGEGEDKDGERIVTGYTWCSQTTNCSANNTNQREQSS